MLVIMAMAIPAPAWAAVASPLVLMLVLLLAVMFKSPSTSRELTPNMLVVAMLSMMDVATAASALLLVYSLIPVAVAVPSTVELLAKVRSPLLSMRVSMMLMLAVEVRLIRAAGKPMTLPVTVDVANKLISPALRVAPVRLISTAPVALKLLSVSDAVRVMIPSVWFSLVRSIVTAGLTVMFSAFTVTLPPLRVKFCAKITVS